MPCRPLSSNPSSAVAAAAMAALLALVAGVWHWQMVRQVTHMAISSERLRNELRMLASAHADSANPDYTHRLATEIAVDPLVRQLQRSSTQLGVTLVSVASTSHDATAQTLGKTDMSVTLRGSYSSMKTVLAESLDRFSGLILQRVTLRRVANTNQLEARVDLMQVVRALAASGVGG